MSVQDIKDTMETWKAQAKEEIPQGADSSRTRRDKNKVTFPAEAFG